MNGTGVAKLYRASAQDFKKISGSPTAYWLSDNLKKIISREKSVSEILSCKTGLICGDNKKYIRFWFEINFSNICFSATSFSDTSIISEKWFPYNHGGDKRKWYGNHNEVVNLQHEADEMKLEVNSMFRNFNYYFKPGITWNRVGSGNNFVSRIAKSGFAFDDVSPTGFTDSTTYYTIIAYLNSKIFNEFLKIYRTALKTEIGHIQKVPFIRIQDCTRINTLASNSIELSRIDWDSFETSWDFQMHPFITHKGATLEESYNNWERFTTSQFAQLKSNEEELNKIFIDIYGLQDELTPEVKDEDVTIRKADLTRDVKSFISYAVGCMFGRYSIDKPGLILANAGETIADYKVKIPDSRFEIDDDNIIPVLDDDYFHDDIVSRFREFLKVVYGKETLEQNMSFIAHALSPESKATPDKVVRDYFLKDFYADHLKIYQKRPIYWMFTSGKKLGFNALIYMHRYNKDTLGKIWGDYLRELEAKLDAEISLLEKADKKNTVQYAKLNKQLSELNIYADELDIAVSKKIEIDLDDGVAANYAKFGKLVRPLK